jgi:hypothetical protein
VSNLKFQKITREALGEDRADELSAMLRLGVITKEEVKFEAAEAVLKDADVLFVFDERPGRNRTPIIS